MKRKGEVLDGPMKKPASQVAQQKKPAIAAASSAKQEEAHSPVKKVKQPTSMLDMDLPPLGWDDPGSDSG